MTKRKPQVGSVSTGTLRTEDLLPVFLDELKSVVTDNQFEYLMIEARRWLDGLDDGDLGSELVSDLIDALNTFAPPFVSFGAHPGDGADFGWWPDVDAAREDDDVLVVSDLSEVLEGYMGHVLVVNDHGNATFYEPKTTFEEVWSCV